MQETLDCIERIYTVKHLTKCLHIHIFQINSILLFNRNFVDKSKVSKIEEKSGASADLLESYKDDGSQSFDIYDARWPLAEHMAFFLPACARTSYNVSLGNSSAATNLKSSSEPLVIDENSIQNMEFEYDVCIF